MTPANRAVRALVGALAATLVIVPAAPAAKDPNQVSRKLREAVTVRGIGQHLQALQNIAAANGGTRASGTPGFKASRDYVVDRLEAAGLDVSVQQFDFDFYRQTGPASFSRTSDDPDTAFVEGEDFNVMDYSGDGTATGAVQAVDVNFADPSVITSGCEDADFAGFTAGNIALLQRGTCTFGEKVTNASEAGAAGAIVFNQGNGGADRTDLFAGTLGAPVTIPAISVSFPFGQELSAPGTTVSITTHTESETRPTWNILADLAPKNPKKAGKTVVVGGHLDSVVAGPGINDNGSGSSTILEIAEQMAAAKAPANPVRFAFWGAEESGLLGSEHYVASLSAAELQKIGLNLNFDMVASPNFVRFVYDGDGSITPDDPDDGGPAGSGDIEQTFERYFASQGLATAPTPFDGRSDYGPFIDVGIPAGGLFSGAEGIKTAEQAATFGGVAGEAYDRCYHQACDTISNINNTGLDQLSDGAAHAVAVYAYAKSGKGKGKPAAEGKRKGPHLQR
jgi:Zn-dependent M28 family amino/carboxypeptidase